MVVLCSAPNFHECLQVAAPGMAFGCSSRMAAASRSLAAAWNSPSAWMILARRSRSLSACLHGHGPTHLVWQIHVLQLDRRSLRPTGRNADRSLPAAGG